MLRGLIINDNLDDILILKRKMAKLINFDSAMGGKAGLALISQFNYDVIFLDLVMPRMNGYEVLERMTMKTIWKTIVMSSMNDGQTMIGAIKRGNENFLPPTASFEVIENELFKMGVLSRDDK